MTSSTSAPARASAAASSWSYGGVNAGGSARTTRTAPRLRPPCACSIRSWNVFHGNSRPARARLLPPRDGRLATAGRPGRALPAGAAALGAAAAARWSGGMTAALVRRAGAPWLAGRARRRDHAPATRASSARRSPARRTRSCSGRRSPCATIASARSATAGERRICHAVRLDGLVVGNLHATNDFPDQACRAGRSGAREELVADVARDGDVCVLAGDFNVARGRARAARPAGRSSVPGSTTCSCAARRRARSSPGREQRRVVDGRVLSDHAPVETTGRMTFEEARALFPVLERLAYLNAGTNGPLARADVEAMRRGGTRDLEDGPRRQGVLRADARAARRGARRGSRRSSASSRRWSR